MEVKTNEWRPGPTVCRCCLAEGCYKDISTEYFWMGKREVYAEMLLETFDMNISYSQSGGPNSNSRLICEPCISRLRDAVDFKRQVSECERTFTQYLDPVATNVTVNIELEKEVKIERVKDEHCLSDDDDYVPPEFDDIEEDDDDDDLDDQPLTKLASKMPKKESVDAIDLLDNAKVNEKRKSSSKTKTSPAKKTKLKKAVASSSKGKPEPRKRKGCGSASDKDWEKITERRGRGPLLRENSLKLLQNSTMLIFQWHKSRFTCFFCKAPFIDIKCLRDHTKTEHAELEKCKIEKKIIAQQNKLLKVEISLLKCKQCDEDFKALSDFRRHLEEKHAVKFEDGGDLLIPFKLETEGLKCQTCPESFTLFRLLSIHVNKHYQNHVCHVCGAGFTSLVLLNLHKTRSHRLIKCKQCNLIFLNRREKKLHDINFHDMRYERKLRFLCPYCEERFFQENLKIQHLVDKHGVEKPQHKCNLCDKIFITRSLCNNHIKNVHKKEKNQECDVCTKLFYTKSDVQRHRVTHTGEKKFTCSLCNNLFATKDSLKRHMKRTHGN